MIPKFLAPLLVFFVGSLGAAGGAVPDQFLVELKPSVSPTDLAAVLNARIIERVRPDVYLIQKKNRLSADLALKELRKNRLVASAEPNVYVHSLRVPNDDEYRSMWPLSNLGHLDKDGTRGLKGVDINAEKAWEITTGSEDVIVAVIDSGIDLAHPDLKDNIWINEAEAKGVAGVDDDGNGFIDDVNGYNFSGGSGDVTDDFGHGTHCAGIIGARGDNQFGIAGVAWKVRLMPVKFLDRYGNGTIANAIKAIDYARLMKAKILNNSWGGVGSSDLLRKAIEDTRNAGQLFIAAAGNSSSDNDVTPIQPAGFSFENLISVTALDNRGSLGDFSNFGVKSVHVAAPGVNVFSSVPGGFQIYSGTSMAAPHVSGLAALLWSKFPAATFAEIRKKIETSVRPIVGLKDRIKYPGIVDAYTALSGESPPVNDPNDPSIWTFSHPYQISTPHPYANGKTEIYSVRAAGAKRLSVRFARFKTESNYDLVQFFNGKNESLGKWSGVHDDEYSPIADGDTLIMKFTADGSNTAYGFDVDRLVLEADPSSEPRPTPGPLPDPVPDPSPTPLPTPVY